jgi:hypothetical protein
MGSVPLPQAGVASGANSALRELGGVVGVAVVGSVFAHQGGYASAATFMHGFTPAVWTACGLTGAGIVAALLTGGRRRAHVPAIAASAVSAAPAAR